MLHYISPQGLLEPLCMRDSRQASCVFVDPQAMFAVSVGVTCQLSYSKTYVQVNIAIAIPSGAQKPLGKAEFNLTRCDSSGSTKICRYNKVCQSKVYLCTKCQCWVNVLMQRSQIWSTDEKFIILEVNWQRIG